MNCFSCSTSHLQYSSGFWGLLSRPDASRFSIELYSGRHSCYTAVKDPSLTVHDKLLLLYFLRSRESIRCLGCHAYATSTLETLILQLTSALQCSPEETAVQRAAFDVESNGCSKPAFIQVNGEEDFTYCCDRRGTSYSQCLIMILRYAHTAAKCLRCMLSNLRHRQVLL